MKNFKAGRYQSQGYYKSFEPSPINRAWLIDDPEVLCLLSKADRAIGKLDMFAQYVPNLELFIQMHELKEATKSSKIEGTQTNIEDALQDIDQIPPERRNDWEEVQNYVTALKYATKKLANLPLSGRLIKEIHQQLMQGVRGEHKQPGEFRVSQNWIGGATINDATFVPPMHLSVIELISDIEKFIHNESLLLPDLLKVAIIHYQFETIHPFLDGNGRIGRLLIPLYLIEKGLIKEPVLYISDFLEKNRSLYYDNLTRVREKNDIKQWLKFMLIGIIETAEKGVNTFDKILKLKNKTEQKVSTLGRKTANALKLVNHLYQNPFTNYQKVMEITGVSHVSAYSLIEQFERLGILIETTGDQRGKSYVFNEYLKLFLND
jgi:Fic family protein